MFIKDKSINVVGQKLKPCSDEPKTGFFRDGCCNTCDADQGSHTVCAVMTAEFLAFSKYVGNDLSTPRPEFDFPGLKEGDSWCICAGTFSQSIEAGTACKIYLKKTNKKTLQIIPLEKLKPFAIDLS